MSAALARPKIAFRCFSKSKAQGLRAKRCFVRASSETDVSEKQKTLEIMRRFSEQYAKRSGTYFCMDKSVTAVVIQGLAEHKEELGAPLCPCRHYDDKQAEADQGFWNCPCVPMRERKEQTITLDEIVDLTNGM